MILSIITINRNNAEGLKKTLASVAAQTHRQIEHIIVDGASTDGSVEVIKEYEIANQSAEMPLTIRWISEPDSGIYNAMNKGIMMATGEYIQILNSGDVLAAADVTARMIEALQDNNQPRILYGNMIKHNTNGTFVRDLCLGDSYKANTNQIVRQIEWTMNNFIRGTINHNPTYIHCSLYEKYGLYDDSLKIVSDWKWFVKAVVFGAEQVYYIPIDVTIFDMTGISETNLDAREQERRMELEKMFPIAVLKDYDRWHFPIEQINRLQKHRLWKMVYFIERVLFKLEKWHILK